MDNICASDLPARPPMAARQDSAHTSAQDPQRYESTPIQLEDGLQQPKEAHLPPSVASSPNPQIEKAAKHNIQKLLDPSDQYVADKKSLQKLADKNPLPQAKHGDLYNTVRYYYFATYQRLFATDLIINLIAITICAYRNAKDGDAFTYKGAVTAVSVNVLVALSMRQEICINMLFHSILSMPSSWSLSIRRHAAKIYCYGGLHPSSGISAVLWYIFFVVLVFKGEFAPTNVIFRYSVYAFSMIILTLLVILCMLSIPPLRSKFHNQWEFTHRWLGWTSVVLIWAQLCCIVASDSWLRDSSIGLNLVKTPAFWMLIVITFLLILPWLRLRKMYFTAEKLSTHAIQLKFKTKKPLPSCVGIGLSNSPLIENHKFATIPNIDNEPGFSVIIANAGDWTKRLIDNPPAYLWTRGTPALGVARCVTVFKRIVLVATGSGIGPLMSFFNRCPEWDMRIVWSARLPLQSYGQENFDNVLRADPEAIIIDTKKPGMKDEDMPSLTEVAYAAVRDFEAEAVVVISNPAVTKEVVLDLEKRKVPAYGAIFDS